MPDNPQYARGQVIDIINSVIDKMDAGRNNGVNREVYIHLSELAQIIDTLKKDISSVKPGHVKNSHIPDAKDELGAVVTATAEATNKIMSVCEEIEAIAGTIGGAPGEEIGDKVTQIYEACGFQDITAQRIRNVVSTFQLIDEKIDRIMGMLGSTVGLSIPDEKFEKTISVEDAKSLLNGPQLPEKAITQDDIDRLLAEFDKK